MKELAVVFVIGLWLGIIINFPYQEYFFTIEPYTNVHVAKSEVKDGKYFMTASFTKTACKFVFLEVYVLDKSTNEWVFLPYEDIPGPTGGIVKGDRVIGNHTLRLSVDLKNIQAEKIEIRTRHTCEIKADDNIKILKDIDKVFLSKNLDN